MDQPLTAAELFDSVGRGYEDAFGRPPAVDAAVRTLLDRLPAGARVLDVGSGTGRPVAEDLTRAGHRVLGVDVSRAMVDIAREQVPGAEFVHADIRTWDTDERFDAVCAFFPFLQMTRAEVEDVLVRLHGRLEPAGLLALITVPMDVEDLEVPFLGHTVRLTSFATPDLLRRVGNAGFTVVETRATAFSPDREGQPDEEHLFVLAQARASATPLA
ncbi:class I SAM-dependent methyltransferase [Saccharothrix longispora]|uniref:class I SAM-dependent methyltransferase n=1 Tax=Saccharothrix longispora TaxID=33920 RepID=UPI0028FD69FC|nr:methyltransferase domain-containing protein [Saccharothrix longispora]MBY8852733.1 methyltransferase domain-containing protein [Saccharothrix sp. MB29]MDU0292250.1 methyltransferase domain-containing protein [Saccharothrix longispora]